MRRTQGAVLFVTLNDGNVPEALARCLKFFGCGLRPAWRDDGSLAGVDFRRDILLKLHHLPVRVIAEAMGASLSHGSKVRGGRLVPHKRHWIALQKL